MGKRPADGCGGAVRSLYLEEPGVDSFGSIPKPAYPLGTAFLLALIVLPQALPSAFAGILHHSIFADYVYPIQADGTLVTESWILARWWNPLDKLLDAAVLIGMIWAAKHIASAEHRNLNLVALILGVLWAGVGAIATLHRWPF